MRNTPDRNHIKHARAKFINKLMLIYGNVSISTTGKIGVVETDDSCKVFDMDTAQLIGHISNAWAIQNFNEGTKGHVVIMNTKGSELVLYNVSTGETRSLTLEAKQKGIGRVGLVGGDTPVLIGSAVRERKTIALDFDFNRLSPWADTTEVFEDQTIACKLDSSDKLEIYRNYKKIAEVEKNAVLSPEIIHKNYRVFICQEKQAETLFTRNFKTLYRASMAEDMQLLVANSLAQLVNTRSTGERLIYSQKHRRFIYDSQWFDRQFKINSTDTSSIGIKDNVAWQIPDNKSRKIILLGDSNKLHRYMKE